MLVYALYGCQSDFPYKTLRPAFFIVCVFETPYLAVNAPIGVARRLLIATACLSVISIRAIKCRLPSTSSIRRSASGDNSSLSRLSLIFRSDRRPKRGPLGIYQPARIQKDRSPRSNELARKYGYKLSYTCPAGLLVQGKHPAYCPACETFNR